MKLYFCHSRAFDYNQELYQPLRSSSLNSEHEIIFPHETAGTEFDTKETIKTSDLVFAEVSSPSTGLGIELGWAESYQVPIVCIYKKGAKISSSLEAVTKNFIEYSNTSDLIAKIKEYLTHTGK